MVVFDTAPTGHTLRFLSTPNLFIKGLSKVQQLKTKFGALFSQVSAAYPVRMWCIQEPKVLLVLLGGTDKSPQVLCIVNRQKSDASTKVVTGPMRYVLLLGAHRGS